MSHEEQYTADQVIEEALRQQLVVLRILYVGSFVGLLLSMSLVFHVVFNQSLVGGILVIVGLSGNGLVLWLVSQMRLRLLELRLTRDILADAESNEDAIRILRRTFPDKLADDGRSG